MPPPKNGAIKKRRSKRGTDFTNSTQSQNQSQSMPTTPNQPRAPIGVLTERIGDSDSDTACGFDSNWNSVSKKPTYI